jgi:S-adenosylmethionine/arginine decarboxylase-like enzyme
MASAPQTNFLNLGVHYYVLAEIHPSAQKIVLEHMGLIIRDICDSLKLSMRSYYSDTFQNPDGVTAHVTLTESSLTIHTYFEHNLMTIDLIVYAANPQKFCASLDLAIIHSFKAHADHLPVIRLIKWQKRATK